MKKLKYISDTPCHFSANGIDYSFHKGEIYEVSEDVAYVKTLVALNKMVEVEAAAEDQPKSIQGAQDSPNKKN